MYRKEDILQCACALFCERGYAATTMHTIAEMLDLKTSSLYTYVKSKDELLWKIVSRTAKLFLVQASTISPAFPVEEQMRLLIRGHLELIGQDLQSVTVFFHEWRYLEPALRQPIKVQRDAYEGCFRRVIAQGVQQRVFQVGDVHLATLFVLSALNWSYHWYDPNGEKPLELIVDMYQTFILRALKGG